MAFVTDIIRGEDPAQRQQFIVDVFDDAFGPMMQADPQAWRDKFRKMSASPFNFYRGSAALFYADMARDDEPFANEKTGRVWIQGDLHAGNFGTYMNSQGILVFDVNDFDEAYVGPFTWDLKRLVASLALIGYHKALSDADIRQMIAQAARSYSDQVSRFASNEKTLDYALTMANTQGKLLEVLRGARLLTRNGMLDNFTVIENYDRRLKVNTNAHSINAATRTKVLAAFEEYLETVPLRKRRSPTSYRIKDIVLQRGMGIGSAGFPSYNILLEGSTEALENDILIYMKQAQVAAPSRVISDSRIKTYFLHDGHRTVISQRALQAYADPWLGYTTLDGAGQLVAEVGPNTHDLDWNEINEMKDILQVLDYMGRAVAKIHCVSDEDSDSTLVPFSTDRAIHEVLSGREEEFVQTMTAFGEGYGDIIRDDHRLFIDAFRNHRFSGL